jgi:hypothetical protein
VVCINGEKHAETSKESHIESFISLVTCGGGGLSLGKTNLLLDGSCASRPKNMVTREFKVTEADSTLLRQNDEGEENLSQQTTNILTADTPSIGGTSRRHRHS